MREGARERVRRAREGETERGVEEGVSNKEGEGGGGRRRGRGARDGETTLACKVKAQFYRMYWN